MGNGLCIFTTNHAGIPDIVNDNVNGYVFNKENIDIDKILDKLILLKNQKNEILKIAMNNYYNIQRDYKEDTYLNNMYSLFEKI